MAAVATRSAAKATAGVVPPASPFSELLRSSRFASYDPKIKQTYGAPPSYARRGNWGLKRPITKRRNSAYITLKSYEDHAQYIEWNSAESQVRFIRRAEELNVTPSVKDHTPWAQNLGPVRNSLWLTDSEFDTVKDKEYRYVMEEAVAEAEETDGLPVEENLDNLGRQGPGKYGASLQSPVKSPLFSQRTGHWNYRRPNIDAMNAEEFEAYLEKLRALRPEFLKGIRARLQDKINAGQPVDKSLNADSTDLQIAVNNSMTSDHNAFLNDYYEQQYAARNDAQLAAPDPESGESLPRDFVKPKIKPQPHRNGGLMYAHPTLLDSYFTNEPRPAFYLQSLSDPLFSTVQNGVPAVSFGGVVAQFRQKPAQGQKPLFTKDSGPSSGNVNGSVLQVRVKTFELQQPPNVVGNDGQGVNGVIINEEVVEAKPHGQRMKDNPEAPGSMGYVHVRTATETKPMALYSRGLTGKGYQPFAIKRGSSKPRIDVGRAAAILKEMGGTFGR